MTPIVTLAWENNASQHVSYGPRGTRYVVTSDMDCFTCTRYTPENPRGTVIGAATRLDRALELAQRDVARLTDEIADESEIRTYTTPAS